MGRDIKTEKVMEASTMATGTCQLKLVSREHGFLDYDVMGHKEVHRITVGRNMRRGDVCNVYGPSSSKRGADWKGGVVATLSGFLGGESVVLDEDQSPAHGLTTQELALFRDKVIPHFGLDAAFPYERHPSTVRDYVEAYRRR